MRECWTKDREKCSIILKSEYRTTFGRVSTERTQQTTIKQNLALSSDDKLEPTTICNFKINKFHKIIIISRSTKTQSQEALQSYVKLNLQDPRTLKNDSEKFWTRHLAGIDQDRTHASTSREQLQRSDVLHINHKPVLSIKIISSNMITKLCQQHRQQKLDRRLA